MRINEKRSVDPTTASRSGQRFVTILKSTLRQRNSDTTSSSTSTRTGETGARLTK
ncbi:MAG TPA: hypothetical protein VH458_18525 [Vicinamibacterales bacterium]